MLGETSGFVKDGDKLCAWCWAPMSPVAGEPLSLPVHHRRPTKQTRVQGHEELHLVQAGAYAHAGTRCTALQALLTGCTRVWLRSSPSSRCPTCPKQATGRPRRTSHLQAQKGPHLVDEPHGQPPGAGTVRRLPALPDLPSSSTKAEGLEAGQEKAEKDEMVGASFFLAPEHAPPPPPSTCRRWRARSGFKSFTKKMDGSALQLNHTANEFARKQAAGLKEYQRVGRVLPRPQPGL